MHTLHFSKMHGIGNDFVVVDMRRGDIALSADVCRLLADRHRGVGCDQIITIEPAPSEGVDAAYGIWNADGSKARQCGNGARCVVAWLIRDGSVPANAPMQLQSPSGVHRAEVLPDGHVRVEMGAPVFEPALIPLQGFADAQPSYEVQMGEGEALTFGAVSMGNPHAVIEVPAVEGMAIESIALALQTNGRFPDSVNVGFAQVLARDAIRLRVYERGAGETLACGSGACAAAAVLMAQGRIDRSVSVHLPGGTLQIDWPGDGQPVVMTGPATFAFEGEFNLEGRGT